MGYYMDKDDQIQNFMRNNRGKILWKTLLLLLAGNKQTWKKMISRFKHKPVVSDWEIINDKYEHLLNNERGDLLNVKEQNYDEQNQKSHIKFFILVILKELLIFVLLLEEFLLFLEF